MRRTSVILFVLVALFTINPATQDMPRPEQTPTGMPSEWTHSIVGRHVEFIGKLSQSVIKCDSVIVRFTITYATDSHIAPQP